YGLQLMLEGMLRSVEGEAPPAADRERHPAAQAVLDLPEEGWGYCTEFLILGDHLDVDRLRGEIEAQGNSVLVVGDEELVKVHVHTDDPPRVISLASGYGRIDRLNVGDMSSQHRRIREESAPEPAEAEAATQPPAADGAQPPRPPRENGIGLVAVVAGQGLIDIFQSLGVDAIVKGGQSMNPSTQEILAAIEETPYDEVLLLPNNKNVVLAANQARGLTEKRLLVLETVTMPQGIAALIAFNPTLDVAANETAMKEATARIQTIEVTHAVRDTKANGMTVRKGDVIALVNDKLRESGRDYAGVVQKALAGLRPEDYELVTVYRGDDVSEEEAETLGSSIHDSYPDLEVDLQAGGQHHYPFILSVE
ncbi:MAG: DAK2 domain-containing protein, partial [Candidatus Dormibacteraeota bacterium]|nr:DAK2 domain-containing protein [Candidatus Dormibacteraeota bacterium]